MTHLDPVTVEECAKVAEQRSARLPHDSDFHRGYAEGRAGAASAIRSLTAGLGIQSSDGGAKVASSAVLASEEDQRFGLHGVMPVGAKAAPSDNTDAGPSETIPSGYADYTPVTVRAHTVVRQDCAPAGTDEYLQGIIAKTKARNDTQKSQGQPSPSVEGRHRDRG